MNRRFVLAQSNAGPKAVSTERSLAISMRTGNRGFTLLEMLIVLMIVMAISMVAIPNVGKTLETYRVQNSASLVSNKVMEARMNAIKRNRQSWIAIDSAEGTVQVQTTEGNPAATVNVGTLGLVHDSVAFQAGTPSEIRFDSMGRPTAPQTVVLESSHLQKTVAVSAAGRVTVD